MSTGMRCLEIDLQAALRLHERIWGPPAHLLLVEEKVEPPPDAPDAPPDDAAADLSSDSVFEVSICLLYCAEAMRL